MRMRLLVLMGLILLLATRVAAQSVDDWYLAWTVDGQLLSFTADGAPKTLIEDGMVVGDAWAWRMDDGSVLALLGTDDRDSRGLFHITRDAAQPILDSSDAPLALDGGAGRFVTQGSYAVLIDGEHLPSGTATLVNAATNTATTIEQQVSFFVDKWSAFSEDGVYFRYLGRDTVDSSTWTLRERKLETGAERVFYTIEDDPYAIATTDTYGEHWLYRQRADTILIARSGDTQIFSYPSPREAVAQRYVGDHMMSYPIDCEVGCQITWTPLSGGEPLIFTMPESDEIQVPNVLAQIDDSHLLVMIDTETLWMLSADGTSLKLGDWSVQTLVTPPDKLLSPDHRWLMAMSSTDDGQAYRVFDLQTLKPVLQNDPAQVFHVLQINYSMGGFIVSEDGLRFRAFRYSDQKALDLGEPGGTFWNVQADGTLLYAEFGDKGEHARGIYRYDADTQVFTSLVEGGIPLFIQAGS